MVAFREGGANVIALGAASSNPDAKIVLPETEISRLAPVIARLAVTGIPLAVDSTAPGRPAVCFGLLRRYSERHPRIPVFMNRIVVPLSATAKRPFSFKMMVSGVIIHIFCVGLPIATVVRNYSRN